MNDATGRDSARDAEVVDVTGYNLTTKEAELLFSDAGVPRTARTIQRYCKSGYLSCKEYQTENGMMLRINQDSVERRIEEIQQIQATTDGRDMPRPAATGDDTSSNDAATTQAADTMPEERQTTTDDDTKNRRGVSPQQSQRGDGNDTERQAATPPTGRDTSSVGNSETVAALREQLEVKDETIRALRDERETIRSERAEDLEFYGNLRQFLRVQVQEVYEERNQLRERVTQLEAQLPAGDQADTRDELPEAQRSPLEERDEPAPAQRDDFAHNEHDDETNPA